MPFGDKTGPLGQGPGVGRGLGPCRQAEEAGSTNPASGRGFGGRNRGGGNRFRASGFTGWGRFRVPVSNVARIRTEPAREQELSALKAEAQRLDSALGDIRKRIGDLEAKPNPE
jgi:hypothetical protein